MVGTPGGGVADRRGAGVATFRWGAAPAILCAPARETSVTLPRRPEVPTFVILFVFPLPFSPSRRCFPPPAGRVAGRCFPSRRLSSLPAGRVARARTVVSGARGCRARVPPKRSRSNAPVESMGRARRSCRRRSRESRPRESRPKVVSAHATPEGCGPRETAWVPPEGRVGGARVPPV